MGLLIGLWVLYLAYIGYKLQDWMSMRKISANLDITDRFFLMHIAIAGSLLGLSVVLKLINQAFAAKFVLALPVGIIIIFFTFKILAFVFVWLAMLLGSK